MVILVFGPPGSGKGTQSRRIGEWMAGRVISTGDMLRAECESGSALGASIRRLLDNGEYVADEVVNRLVERQLDLHRSSGIILDGYPRTLQQALFLEDAMRAREFGAPAVLHLDVPVEELIGRLAARVQCSGCGSVFHVARNPSRSPGICDNCGHALATRSDDQPDVITQRLAAYERLTGPVLAHFAQTCHRIDGTGSPDQVFQRIHAVLGRQVNGRG